jgi:asparagine synthase (glutamine-hydrolysing)
MCGLVGVCTHQLQQARTATDSGLAALIHRGPDDEGTFFHSGRMSLGLGLRRLAIQDLSASGHQPMSTKDGKYVISFNGEITNFLELRRHLQSFGYTFVSQTDTEVLLTAWTHMGSDCLGLLEGMFAFAVFDREEHTVTLVRDPFGIKPLFFKNTADGSLYFSSEMPSLLKMLSERPRMNVQRVVDYLQWGLYDESHETFIDGVEQLLPGHLMQFSLTTGNVCKLETYWTPSIETAKVSFSDASHHVRELFLDSVRRNLIADVPVGVALSGGIDSSSIAGAIKHLDPERPFYAFSYIAEGQPFSELEWTEKAINGSKAHFHQITVSDNDLAEDLDELVIAQGEPFGSTSVYAQWRVFKEVRKDGIVVTLDGQGADEIFAGYEGYPSARLRSLIKAGQIKQAAEFLKAWSAWPGRSKMSALTGALAQASPNTIYSLMRMMSKVEGVPGLNKSALNDHEINMEFPRRILIDRTSPTVTYLKEELRSIYRYRGLPALLRHGDRNSMSASVESRVPFLDRNLVEFSLSLPENFLISDNGESKSVFRAAMRGIVPDSILDRRDKIGFETPQRIWIDKVLSQHGTHLNDLLGSSDIFRIEKSALPDFWSGLGSNPASAWRVINFLKWSELFNIDTSL